MSFAKNTSNKYSQKLMGSAKRSTPDAIKTASKRVIQKTAEDLIGNKTADKITSVSKKYPKELHSQNYTQSSKFRTKNWIEIKDN